MADKSPRFLLSTTDNPYSPFSQWEQWYMHDLRKGYDTCGLIARLGCGSKVLDDEVEASAMRTIVHYNFSGVHITVVPEDYDLEIEPT